MQLLRPLVLLTPELLFTTHTHTHTQKITDLSVTRSSRTRRLRIPTTESYFQTCENLLIFVDLLSSKQSSGSKVREKNVICDSLLTIFLLVSFLSVRLISMRNFPISWLVFSSNLLGLTHCLFYINLCILHKCKKDYPYQLIVIYKSTRYILFWGGKNVGKQKPGPTPH